MRGGSAPVLRTSRTAAAFQLYLTVLLFEEVRDRLHPNLKCLFMSGYSAEVIADHGVLKDGVSFIQKPLSAKLLSNEIRRALGK